jgi:8-oxo-dGTP pyrophosphatase MutT (NUDIX family)
VTPSPVARLLHALDAHEPGDALEVAAVRRTRRMLEWLRDPFSREGDPTHVTASAIVVDGDGRVLLHRHVRLGIWIQPGGHIEPGEDVVEAAIRETLEETGVMARPRPGAPGILHVDVHQGPLGHVHLDVRSLLVAESATAPGPGVVWVDRAAASARADRSLADALRALDRHLPRD